MFLSLVVLPACPSCHVEAYLQQVSARCLKNAKIAPANPSMQQSLNIFVCFKAVLPRDPNCLFRFAPSGQNTTSRA